jgi:Tfp pilus assembly protein FimV
LVVLGLVVVLLVAVSSLWGAVSSASAHGSAPVAPTEASAHLSVAAPALSYVVQPGDSLWTIARRLQPQGDVRPLVDQLSERNGGPSLRAGQRLDLHGLRY